MTGRWTTASLVTFARPGRAVVEQAVVGCRSDPEMGFSLTANSVGIGHSHLGQTTPDVRGMSRAPLIAGREYTATPMELVLIELAAHRQKQ